MPKNKRAPWMPPPRKAWTHTNRWEGYQTTAWKEFSYYFKIANPTCATPGCNGATYYTDHVNPEDKYTDPLNPDKCQPLCWHCGNVKSGKESGEARRAKKDRQGRGGITP